MALPTLTGLISTAYQHPLYLQHLLVRKFASLARYRWAEKNPGRDHCVPPPQGNKLVLTYKCNLRCIMCYEWGDVGWCHDRPAQAVGEELDLGIVRKIFRQVGHQRPYFILHGGEPLLYSHFRVVASLLKEHRCFSITCTNGIALDRYRDVFAHNPYLTLLVSLDGLEEQNDRLRGRGVYRKVTENIRLLKRLKAPPYIGVQFTIRPENVGVMHAFCKEMVELGIDWVLLNPCWFVSESQARAYEQFMLKHFNIMPKTHLGYLMPYEIDKQAFLAQTQRINAERWPIQVSCYLRRPEDIHTFVDTPDVPPGNRFCYQQWSRMDITPTGQVTPCILYPDLKVGDLGSQDVLEAWNSPAFVNFRQLRRREILPVCAKCNALYLHDRKRSCL
jgi:MoaA/NifB/PqqE/SkfB family radical SAM enzyme